MIHWQRARAKWHQLKSTELNRTTIRWLISKGSVTVKQTNGRRRTFPLRRSSAWATHAPQRRTEAGCARRKCGCGRSVATGGKQATGGIHTFEQTKGQTGRRGQSLSESSESLVCSLPVRFALARRKWIFFVARLQCSCWRRLNKLKVHFAGSL